MGQKTKAQKGNRPLLLVALLLLVLLALGLLLRLCRTNPALARLTGLGGAEAAETSLRFTGGTGEAFALAGDNLAVASSTGAQLLSLSGTTVASSSFAMDQPAVSASASVSLFYDAGGTAAVAIAADGTVTNLAPGYPILSGDVSENGYVTLTTEYPGYRGRVTVYSPQLSPLFQYDSGESGYPLCARVSPQGLLVASCVSSGGSVLRVFALDSETERGSYTAPGELILDFDFLEDGAIAAVTGNELLFLDSSAALSASRSFDGKYLADYCLTGKCAAVLLHNNRSGNEGELWNVNARGRVVGRLETSRAVSGLSADGEKLLVQYSDELTLYNASLSDDVSYQHVENVKRALLRPNGSALLLSSYGADTVSFG